MRNHKAKMSENSNTQNLKTTLSTLAASSAAGVQVLLKQTGTQNTAIFEKDAHKQAVSASMIKVPIAAAALLHVQNGTWCLDTPFSVHDADILPDSIPFENGARTATLAELLTWMLVISDNTATNVLIRAIGFDAVNAFCHTIGLVSTELQRKMLDFDAIKEGKNNYTSPADMARLFDALYEHTILSPTLCQWLLDTLKKQRVQDGFLRYIWQDVSLAHKTGCLDYLNHDAGVFECASGCWFLAVFISNAPHINGDRALCGKIARAVYDAIT